MHDPEPHAPTRRPEDVPGAPRYRARLVARAEVDDRGLAHGGDAERVLVPWAEVRRAFAAEVGEPEGIRTVVFDLVVGIEGPDCVALRFDAEPGEPARTVARAIELGAGADRCDAALHTVAEDGFAVRTYPDLPSFDEACLETLLRKGLG